MTTVDKIKDFFGFAESHDQANETPTAKKIKPFKVSSTSNTKNFASSQIIIMEAKIYEDSLTIAKYLRENNPVIVNLKFLDNDTGKRLIDFICGTAFAINGHMLKIGENIFLFTPAAVQISNNTEESNLGNSLDADQKEIFFKQANG